MSRTRVIVGVWTGPPNVLGLPNPASSINTIKTFGASSGACGPGIIDQSDTESRRVRPQVPPNFRSGIGSTVRSGANLPDASARASLSSPTVLLSISAIDFMGEPGSACSIASRSEGGNIARMTAVPSLRPSPTLPSTSARTLLPATLPTAAPPAAPTTTEPRSTGLASPTSRPTPLPHVAPLRPALSPVSFTLTVPSGSLATRIIPWALISLARTFAASASNSASAVCGS